MVSVGQFCNDLKLFLLFYTVYKNTTVYKSRFDVKSSSAKLNQRTAKYLYMLKIYLQNNIFTNPSLKVFQNDTANNEIALTVTIFQRRCLSLVHTRPSGWSGPRRRTHKTKNRSLSALPLCLPPPPHELIGPKGRAQTRL